MLANGSMSSNQSGEGEIRKAIVEADLVDCMVALPGQLFYSTQIPVCLWFFAATSVSPRPARRGRAGGRDRRGEILFIDARKLGTLTDRVHRELTDDDIARIADTYHAWRGHRCGRGGVTPPLRRHARFLQERNAGRCRGHGHVLTPGRYVGAEEVEDDGEPFEEDMARLAETCASSRPRPRSWTPPSPPT